MITTYKLKMILKMYFFVIEIEASSWFRTEWWPLDRSLLVDGNRQSRL